MEESRAASDAPFCAGVTKRCAKYGKPADDSAAMRQLTDTCSMTRQAPVATGDGPR